MASIFVLMQGMKKCGPEGRNCIEKNSAETFNCSMTCEGMYVDIGWKSGIPNGKIPLPNGKDRKKYAELRSEYQNFKKENVKHFRFSSEASRSMFGEQILI